MEVFWKYLQSLISLQVKICIRGMSNVGPSAKMSQNHPVDIPEQSALLFPCLLGPRGECLGRGPAHLEVWNKTQLRFLCELSSILPFIPLPILRQPALPETFSSNRYSYSESLWYSPIARAYMSCRNDTSSRHIVLFFRRINIISSHNSYYLMKGCSFLFLNLRRTLRLWS